jgi:hypothetical protein
MTGETASPHPRQDGGSMKNVRQFKAWVGFCDGRPLPEKDPSFYDGARHIKIFPSKKVAKRCFADVREYILIPLPVRRKK